MTGKRLSWVSLVTAGVALVGASVVQARHGAGEQSAPVPGPASPRASAVGLRAEGRVVAYPGAEVVIAAERGGKLLRLPVKEGDRVRKGQLVGELASEEERAQLMEARARREEAEADQRYFESEASRAQTLFQARAVPQSQYDKATHERDTARARVSLSTATVQRLEASLQKLRIRSPIDGVVTLTHAQEGETLASNAALLTVVDLSRVRIEAEVDEFDVAHVALGASARIEAEGLDRHWQGRVEEIPAAVSARKLKPQDPGQPSDARVLLVKIALRDMAPLKLGQRVEVAIEDVAR